MKRPAAAQLARSKGASSDDDAAAASRQSLRPLMALTPYLARHPARLAGAGVALVVSAMAMLAVPTAVRRMIDHGFGAHDGTMIDQYFMMLIAIGLVLAVASASRFYLVNWIGERVVADLRADVFAHLARLGLDFYERTHSGEVMSRLTGDTTQVKAGCRHGISQALRNVDHAPRRARDDDRDQPAPLASGPDRHSDHRAAADRLRAHGPPPFAPRPGHAGGGIRLCRRKPLGRAHHAGLRA